MFRTLREAENRERALQLEPWYAVYTKHHHEKTASELLAGKGFEVFLPLYRAERRWKDRNKVVSLPLFPGYLFLRTSLGRRVEILRTPGVFWLVESAGRPCEVPDLEIEALRRVTESPARIAPHRFLKCGDAVRIREGALAGIEGILTRVRNRYRVVLSVELLQKSIAVEVEASLLEPIGPQGALSRHPQEQSGVFVGA